MRKLQNDSQIYYCQVKDEGGVLIASMTIKKTRLVNSLASVVVKQAIPEDIIDELRQISAIFCETSSEVLEACNGIRITGFGNFADWLYNCQTGMVGKDVAQNLVFWDIVAKLKFSSGVVATEQLRGRFKVVCERTEKLIEDFLCDLRSDRTRPWTRTKKKVVTACLNHIIKCTLKILLSVQIESILRRVEGESDGDRVFLRIARFWRRTGLDKRLEATIEDGKPRFDSAVWVNMLNPSEIISDQKLIVKNGLLKVRFMDVALAFRHKIAVTKAEKRDNVAANNDDIPSDAPSGASS